MNEARPEQQVELSRVRVRLICAHERDKWDGLMRAHHYLGLTAMVGRSLRYVAEIDGHWLALLGWASPALKCASRDTWIGWSPALQWQRLGLIANNSRFLILPCVRVKNLASRVLGLNLARLSADWRSAHGHHLLLAETFILDSSVEDVFQSKPVDAKRFLLDSFSTEFSTEMELRCSYENRPQKRTAIGSCGTTKTPNRGI